MAAIDFAQGVRFMGGNLKVATALLPQCCHDMQSCASALREAGHGQPVKTLVMRLHTLKAVLRMMGSALGDEAQRLETRAEAGPSDEAFWADAERLMDEIPAVIRAWQEYVAHRGA